MSFLPALCALAAFLQQAPVHDGPAVHPTGTPAYEWARKVTDSTDDIAIGLALCLGAADKDDGRRLFDELGDAALWSGAVTTALKYVTHVPRPDDPASQDSFASGHASLAFNVATVLTDEYPVLAPLWYAWATGVAASRVMLGRHRVDEVIVGVLWGSRRRFGRSTAGHPSSSTSPRSGASGA